MAFIEIGDHGRHVRERGTVPDGIQRSLFPERSPYCGRALAAWSGCSAGETLERDIGDRERVSPFGLGHLFNMPVQVGTNVEAMVAAGAKVRKTTTPPFFDGHPASVEALDGSVWELVYNPVFHFDFEGTPHFAPPGG